MIPFPYGRQRPVRIDASSSTLARSSFTSRDLPIPAAPMTLITRHSRSRTASSKAVCSRSSSSWRSTIGESSRLANAGAPERTPSSRHARTGCDVPFSSSGSRGSTSTASRTSWYVVSPIRISPALAAASSRCATATAEPVANACPSAGSPATTSPVLTPVRKRSSMPYSARSSSFSSCSD